MMKSTLLSVLFAGSVLLPLQAICQRSNSSKSIPAVNPGLKDSVIASWHMDAKYMALVRSIDSMHVRKKVIEKSIACPFYYPEVLEPGCMTLWISNDSFFAHYFLQETLDKLKSGDSSCLKM